MERGREAGGREGRGRVGEDGREKARGRKEWTGVKEQVERHTWGGIKDAMERHRDGGAYFELGTTADNFETLKLVNATFSILDENCQKINVDQL